MSAVEDAKKFHISGFYEDDYPVYTQGPPTHELQSLLTAAEANGLVARIKTLEKALKDIKDRVPQVHRI